MSCELVPLESFVLNRSKNWSLVLRLAIWLLQHELKIRWNRSDPLWAESRQNMFNFQPGTHTLPMAEFQIEEQKRIVKWPVNQDHGNSHGCSSRHQKIDCKSVHIWYVRIILIGIESCAQERESEKHWKNMNKKILLDPFTSTISWCCSCWNLFLLHHDLLIGRFEPFGIRNRRLKKLHDPHPAAEGSDFLPTPMAKGPNFPKTPSVGPWFAMTKRPCPTHSFATMHFAPWFRRSSASATIRLNKWEIPNDARNLKKRKTTA